MYCMIQLAMSGLELPVCSVEVLLCLLYCNSHLSVSALPRKALEGVHSIYLQSQKICVSGIADDFSFEFSSFWAFARLVV